MSSSIEQYIQVGRWDFPFKYPFVVQYSVNHKWISDELAIRSCLIMDRESFAKFLMRHLEYSLQFTIDSKHHSDKFIDGSVLFLTEDIEGIFGFFKLNGYSEKYRIKIMYIDEEWTE